MPCTITMPFPTLLNFLYFPRFSPILIFTQVAVIKKKRNLHFWVRRGSECVLTAISFTKIEKENVMQALHFG